MNTLEAFIQRHQDSQFRHKNELWAGIKAGQIIGHPEPHEANLPCQHFLLIYRRRSEHLGKYGSDHARNLRADALAFCEELEKTPDELVRFWTFEQPPKDFIVFEGINSGRVLGCLRTVSKLLVDEESWHKLWGK